MKEKDKKMELPKVTLDDLFTTQEQRDDLEKESIYEIPLSEIDDFPEHPYKVIVNDSLKEMSKTIEEHGVNEPVIVRKKDNGRYEMISRTQKKKSK